MSNYKNIDEVINNNINSISKTINYNFSDNSLIAGAIVHPSIGNNLNRNVSSKSLFERLEFIGDKVLNLCISSYIYTKHSDWSEKDMSVHLSQNVSTKAIYNIALYYNLNEYIIANFSQKNSSYAYIADAVEAIIGAIYIDSNYITVYNTVTKLWSLHMQDKVLQDSKTLLQEFSQEYYNVLPEYILLDQSGSQNEPVFTMKVQVNQYSSSATGRSKKQAQQHAAKNMLDELQYKVQKKITTKI